MFDTPYVDEFNASLNQLWDAAAEVNAANDDNEPEPQEGETPPPVKLDYFPLMLLRDFYNDERVKIEDADNWVDFFNFVMENNYYPYFRTGENEFVFFNKQGVSPGLGNTYSDISEDLWKAIPAKCDAAKTEDNEQIANHKKFKTFKTCMEKFFIGWKKVNNR